jgi:hypothetical protein
LRNCTKDEGRLLGVGLQEQASNRLKLLWTKAMVVSVEEKAWQRLCQVWIKEMNVSEPLMRCRNIRDGVKTGVLADLQDKLGGNLFTA